MTSPIKGYRELSPEEIKTINDIKTISTELGHLVTNLRNHPSDIDLRWVDIGATDLQTGIMALVRAVARPETF